MKAVQLSLNLFTSLTFWEILSQDREKSLTVTISKRLKNGWYVLVKPITGKKNLVIPQYLEDAPEYIKHALIEWALLPGARKKEKKLIIKKRKKELESSIWDYIKSCGIDTTYARIIDPNKIITQNEKKCFDLQQIFDELNITFFNGSIDAVIRWGRFASTTSYQSTAKDKKGNLYNLITVAGVYDHPSVPEFAIKAVVYHEMLHIKFPPYRRNCRRVVHGPEYRRAERQYEHYTEWRNWEKKVIHKYAREMKRKRRKSIW